MAEATSTCGVGRSIYLLKTHVITPFVVNEFVKLKQAFGPGNVFITMDVSARHAWDASHAELLGVAPENVVRVGTRFPGGGAGVLLIDEATMKLENPLHKANKLTYETAWVLLHRALHLHESYDFMWSIENDVYCNGSWRTAVDRCSHMHEDFLAHNINKPGEGQFWPNWAWDRLYGDWNVGRGDRVRAFCAVCRLSARFVRELEARLGRTSGFVELYPSTLCNHVQGFSMGQMPHEMIGLMHWACKSREWLDAQLRSDDSRDRLFHPVKSAAVIMDTDVRELEGMGMDLERAPRSAGPEVELVVSRYREDLCWLAHVPSDIEVTVYDKSDSLGATPPDYDVESLLTVSSKDDPACSRSVRLRKLRNIGREADTYLRHILRHYQGDELARLTIFCQGNPFEHSPDFLRLLTPEVRSSFRSPVQPLTDRWKVRNGVPPQITLDRKAERARCDISQEPYALAGFRVAAYPISMFTLDTLEFIDPGAPSIRDKTAHSLQCRGENLIERLLRSAGCVPPPPGTIVAQLCFGAMFAVTREAIQKNPVSAYEYLRRYNDTHSVGPWALERSWMSIFGAF